MYAYNVHFFIRKLLLGIDGLNSQLIIIIRLLWYYNKYYVSSFFDSVYSWVLSFTVSYEKSDLKYVWKNNSNVLMKSSYLKSSNAYLERNRTYECASTGSWRGNDIF